MIGLWQYNTRSGRWDLQRECDPNTADAWLARYQADEPTAQLQLATRRPRSEAERKLAAQQRTRKRAGHA